MADYIDIESASAIYGARPVLPAGASGTSRAMILAFHPGCLAQRWPA